MRSLARSLSPGHCLNGVCWLLRACVRTGGCDLRLLDVFVAQSGAPCCRGAQQVHSLPAASHLVVSHALMGLVLGCSLLFYPVQYEGQECSKNIFYGGAFARCCLLPAVLRPCLLRGYMLL